MREKMRSQQRKVGGAGVSDGRAGGAPPVSPALAEFEQQRLSLFARHGFDGEARWITDRQGRFTYTISRGEGPCPTVLIHGGLSQAGEWSLVAGALPGHVVIPDRPGCGLSEPVDDRKVDLRSSAAEWVADLVDALGADQVDLVGNSMGGLSAMAFAVAQPARVRNIVLVGAPMGLGREVPFLIRLWGTPVTGHIISRTNRVSREKTTDPEANRRAFSQLVAHPEALPLEILENDLAAMGLPGVDRSAYTMLRAGLTLRGVRRHLVFADEMAQLHTPTLFLWGDAETFVPRARGKAVAERMPNARFEAVRDAGHMVHLDRPDVVASAVIDFLGKGGRAGVSGGRAGGPPPLSSALAEFEQQRLSLFARHGFDGEARWISDRHGRYTYTISRDEGSCPTVLIHGGLSEASEWSLLEGRLPGHVVIADRPGCGLSYPIDYRTVDCQRGAADWLAGLIDGIGADQVDPVGNSMGGFFATCFAVANPHRVRRLVLVGAPAGLHRELPLFIRLWGNPITGRLISRLKITDPEVFRKQVVARLLVAHPASVPVELLETMIAAAALPGVDRTAYSMLRAVTTMRGWRTELMLHDDLAQLPVPTLFLWGDADAFAPPSRGTETAARMPDARFEVIPGAGHLPYLDHPGAIDIVADRVNRFLAHP